MVHLVHYCTSTKQVMFYLSLLGWWSVCRAGLLKTCQCSRNSGNEQFSRWETNRYWGRAGSGRVFKNFYYFQLFRSTEASSAVCTMQCAAISTEWISRCKLRRRVIKDINTHRHQHYTVYNTLETASFQHRGRTGGGLYCLELGTMEPKCQAPVITIRHTVTEMHGWV